MRPHRVQQPDPITHITMPTGSIPNAHNGYIRIFRIRSGRPFNCTHSYVQITIECLFCYCCQDIDRTYEVLEGRTVYTEGERECILKKYREERERNEWRDTNVTNTLKSLKGELLGRLNLRENKAMKLSIHTIGQQWQQLEALLVHLVERIEELESADAHKQKRIEVLTRKIQLMEE